MRRVRLHQDARYPKTPKRQDLEPKQSFLATRESFSNAMADCKIPYLTIASPKTKEHTMIMLRTSKMHANVL